VLIEDPPQPEITLPSEGRCLADMGFTNPAAEFIWLPPGLSISYRADQPNLLTIAGPADQSSVIEDYLHQTLPGLGWQITSRGDGGLLFERGQWHAGFAVGVDNWALTARND